MKLVPNYQILIKVTCNKNYNEQMHLLMIRPSHTAWYVGFLSSKPSILMRATSPTSQSPFTSLISSLIGDGDSTRFSLQFNFRFIHSPSFVLREILSFLISPDVMLTRKIWSLSGPMSLLYPGIHAYCRLGC